MKLSLEDVALVVLLVQVTRSEETTITTITTATSVPDNMTLELTETTDWTTTVSSTRARESRQRVRTRSPPRRRTTRPTSDPPRPEFARRRQGAGYPRPPFDPLRVGPDYSRQSSEYPRVPPEYPRPNFGTNYGRPETGLVTSVAARNTTRVDQIHAECFDNYMRVTVQFNGSFNGLVYSSGYSQDRSCSYVNGSGRFHYEFYIRLNRCGTLGRQDFAGQRGPNHGRVPDRAQNMVNVISIQYNPLIEEEGDEHFRVICEYGYEFWKTVTFPFVDVESNTGSSVVFTLPPPQCTMEVRHGYGPSGLRTGGPVTVGDPLTLLIHMKSETNNFDILVSNCVAHNGANKRLQLIDENGCVAEEKLVGSFRGMTNPDRTPQLTLYAYLKAFRFTGSPALYLECDIHMCHGQCPPQRCYWRNVYKRSAPLQTTTPSPVSESVSLFQSLEVLSEEEKESPEKLRAPGDINHNSNSICLRTAGFAALLSGLLIFILLIITLSICMCSHMHRTRVRGKTIEPYDNYSGDIYCTKRH